MANVHFLVPLFVPSVEIYDDDISPYGLCVCVCVFVLCSAVLGGPRGLLSKIVTLSQ